MILRKWTARIRTADVAEYIAYIVDTGAAVPPGTQIGVNPEDDARRFYMSEGGVALVTRDMAARLIKKG